MSNWPRSVTHSRSSLPGCALPDPIDSPVQGIRCKSAAQGHTVEGYTDSRGVLENFAASASTVSFSIGRVSLALRVLLPLLALSLAACTARDVVRAHASNDSRQSGIEVAAANAPEANDATDDDELAASGIAPEQIEAKGRDGGTFKGESENVVREIHNRGEFMHYVCKRLPPEQRDAAIEAQFRRGYAVFCGTKVGPKALLSK